MTNSRGDKDNNQYAIYGCGGFGRELLPLLRDNISSVQTANDNSVVFVSDDSGDIQNIVNGAEVVSFEGLKETMKSHEIIIAIGDSLVRRKVKSKCELAGFSFASLFANTSRMLDVVKLGKGAVLCDFVTITSNVVIGEQFHANIYSYVAHDCVIGDYVTLAPRVCINGNTVLEDDVYIGTGAILKQGTESKPLTIGHGAIVGMGSVVTKDVPPGAVVVGNPARVLKFKPGYEQEKEFQVVSATNR